jgi:ATP-dependent exoDNAse (exonuclease V) alpha subunit
VLLPPGSSGITTRELLYTAFTRARFKVTLYADPDTVRDALDRQVRRHSRIQDWAAG